MHKDFIQKLKNELKKPLPGFEAHIKMIPGKRDYQFEAGNYKKSAVNIILFPFENSIRFILTKRKNGLSHHSGQISLPGGKKDEDDTSLWETCKRETIEETGIMIKDKNYIGNLSNLLIPVSNFDVLPFMSFIDKAPTLPNSNNEVEKFFKIDLFNFFSKKNIFEKKMNFNGHNIVVPYYKLDSEIVWGATAMILSEFNYILKRFA